ncbi:MAG TPA: SLBB domain-containing protein [Candidatus Deferrimicrobium sp.]|nr:SLBB domain-containing protein [Candidatus Deferrimicrobium sp.]
MIFRIIILLLLVIVLVSLNWFKVLLAQDLTSILSDKELQLLKERQVHEEGRGQTSESEYYQSPRVFDQQPPKDPADSGSNAPRNLSSTASDPAGAEVPVADGALRRLPEFDELRPFGSDLFKAPSENEPPADIASAPDYILGPGDNIIIYLWGRAEREYNLTVDREGKVFIPRVGEIIAWGLTLERFTQAAKKQFSKAYSEFDLTISLGKVRSIRIYVTGEVARPGAYTVSSLTSLFNAIYLAGGPNERGTMRSIKLMRQGQPAAFVDLYNLLLAGDNSTDVRLQSGDVIFVPVTGARVAVRGQVRRSALYELKGEETAPDVLILAGGTTAEAHLERVMLERVSKASEWEVIDMNLSLSPDSGAPGPTLKDGDRITVFSIFDFKANRVAIHGHVKHPGAYERNDTTRVRDLVLQGELQPYDVYYERADLFRRYADRRIEVIPVDLTAILAGDAQSNLLLQDQDSLHVYSIDEVQRDKYAYIEGEVDKPGRYPLYDSMTVKDLIFLAGSFTRAAERHQAEIARLDSLGNVSLIYVNLDDDGSGQSLLAEDDHVYIRQIPEWRLQRAITIDGEVNYPGNYTISNRDETLYDLLQRAGGFTKNAFPKGIIFDRRSIGGQLERQKVQQLLDRSQPLIEDSLGNLVQQRIFEYDLQAMNRVIIDIEKIIQTKGRDGDVILEPGDRIYVPPVPSGISVMGAVGANGTIKFVKGKNVEYYVKRAGNFTRQSDKGEVRLMRAEGEVLSGNGTLGKKVELGDVIIVPSKIEKDRNWLRTLTTAVGATTGVLTSVYIVSRM